LLKGHGGWYLLCLLWADHTPAQCTPSTWKATNRFIAAFGFEGAILVSLVREEKYFFQFINNELKRFRWKLEIMTFYVVILAMFKFTGIMPIPTHMGIVLGLLRTYKIILKRQKFGQICSKFTT